MTDETDSWYPDYVPHGPWDEDENTGDAITWPLLDVVETGTVWHYTTGAGLLGILTSRTLRASSAGMLNDTTEMTHGMEILWGAVSDLDSEMTQPAAKFVHAAMTRTSEYMRSNTAMVACASTEGDDLAQWRAYAEGSGYAIGLRPYERLSMIAAAGRAPMSWRGTSESVPGWGRVVYAPDEKSALARKAVRFVASMVPPPDASPADLLIAEWAATGAFAPVISHLKHEGFVSESEVRLVQLVAGLEDSVRLGVRESPLGLTPYTELAVPLDAASQFIPLTTAEPGGLPIERIRVGPGPNQEAARRGLEASLPLLGYANVSVDISSVPFR